MNWRTVPAFTLLFLIMGGVFYEAVAAPFWVIPLIAIVSGAIGAALGYWYARTQEQVQAAEQVRHILSSYFYSLELAYKEEWNGILTLMNQVTESYSPGFSLYHIRLAEHLASVACQREIVPFEVVGDQIISNVTNLVISHVRTVLTLIWNRYENGRSYVDYARTLTNVNPMPITIPGVGTVDAFWILLHPVYVVYDKTNQKYYVGIEADGIGSSYPYSQNFDPEAIAEPANAKVEYVVVVDGQVIVLGDVEFGRRINIYTDRIESYVKNYVDPSYGGLRMITPQGATWFYTGSIYGVEWGPRFLRNIKVNYEMYCEIVYYTGAPFVPPPSIILPVDPNELEKLPPEMRLALYLAYLRALSGIDWSKVVNVTAQDIQTVVGGVRISGVAGGRNYTLTPVVIPLPIAVQKGMPMPVFGVWFNGTHIISYDLVVISNPQDYTFERIAQMEENITYFWVKQGVTVVGLGVDYNGDNVPDIYAPFYLENVTEILDYNPTIRMYESKDRTRLGPATADEWFSYYGIRTEPRQDPQTTDWREVFRRLIDQLRNIFNLRTTTGWLAAAGLLLVILLLAAVAAGGRTKVMVIGGRALSPSKYFG